MSLCIFITENRYGWYLCHLSILDLTAPIIIIPPSALPLAISFFFFFCYHNLTRVLAYLYLSFSCFVLRLTLHILTTTLFLTLFHAVMVHFGNTLYMQKELVLGVILPLFPYRVVCARVLPCVCLCVCMWVGGFASEIIYKGISPGGVEASLQWRESKGGGGKVVHSKCSEETTGLKTFPHLTLHCTVNYLFIYLGWRAKYMFNGIGYQWQEGSKSDTTNEAVRVARQPGPEANIPLLHILLWSQRNLTARRKVSKKGGKENHHLPNRREGKETKRALLYHCRPW